MNIKDKALKIIIFMCFWLWFAIKSMMFAGIIYFGLSLIYNYPCRFAVPIGWGIIMSTLFVYFYYNEIDEKIDNKIAERLQKREI